MPACWAYASKPARAGSGGGGVARRGRRCWHCRRPRGPNGTARTVSSCPRIPCSNSEAPGPARPSTASLASCPEAWSYPPTPTEACCSASVSAVPEHDPKSVTTSSSSSPQSRQTPSRMSSPKGHAAIDPVRLLGPPQANSAPRTVGRWVSRSIERSPRRDAHPITPQAGDVVLCSSRLTISVADWTPWNRQARCDQLLTSSGSGR